ncbi:MAG: hypothetical protein P9M14_00370 [Candidatus Alcyoniella australis]|nr:hypothetical protein [Candidatus Alcyoniella australis]
MLQKTSFTLSAILALVLIAAPIGCGGQQAPAPATQPVADGQVVAEHYSGEKSTQSQSSYDNASNAYAEFTRIRREDPIDFAALTSLYQTELAAYVTRADSYGSTQIELEIRQALQKGANGEHAHGNVQTAEKLIGYAFLLTFVNNLNQLAIGAENGDALHLLRGSGPSIRSAAVRRSVWLGEDNLLPAVFDAAWKAVEIAEQGEDPQALDSARQQMQAFIAKIYTLSVLYELDGLSQARGQDANIAEEKLAEACTYYRYIQAEHQRRNAPSAKNAGAELAKQPADVNCELVRELLLNDFKPELADVATRLPAG